MHKVSDKLGHVIRSARLEKHLTQKQLAKRLSITPHYLMSIENKKQIPSCDLLFRIIRELEISADTIFTRSMNTTTRLSESCEYF